MEDKCKRRLSQPARKPVERLNQLGEVVDCWDSTRQMCENLGFDRRAVIRVLNKEPRFKSVHGYTFRYKEDQ